MAAVPSPAASLRNDWRTTKHGEDDADDAEHEQTQRGDAGETEQRRRRRRLTGRRLVEMGSRR